MKASVYCVLLACLSSFILLAGCKKDNNAGLVLPDASQTGKNTIGFMVDGKVWLPSYKCNFGGNSCGELEAGYGLPLVPENSFTFFTSRRTDRISSLSLVVNSGATISTTGNKTDSIRVVYTSEEWAGSTLPGRFIGPLAGSSFVVTKLDRANRIISGEFNLVLQDTVNASSQKMLSSGRFDFQFYACKCTD